MDTLLILGSIFTLGGIVLWIIGGKQGVPNASLWGLFPILHGAHEFAEYVIDLGNDAILLERLEVIFAISSTLVLLAACIEFLGVIPHPFGKFIAGNSFLVVLYFVLFSDHDLFETMEMTSYTIGFLTAPFFRFFFGFILVFLSILVLIFSYFALKRRENVGDLSYEKNIIILSSIMLFIFSFFEGFKSDNGVFITFRGISAILFLLIPTFVLFSNKLGLLTLLITQENGNYVVGYNFPDDKVLDDDQSILTGSFIAAVSKFSQNESDIGSLSQIASSNGTFMIISTGEFLVTLLTRNTHRQLSQKLLSLSKVIDEFAILENGTVNLNSDKFKDCINQLFSQFN